MTRLSDLITNYRLIGYGRRLMAHSKATKARQWDKLLTCTRLRHRDFEKLYTKMIVLYRSDLLAVYELAVGVRI